VIVGRGTTPLASGRAIAPAGASTGSGEAKSVDVPRAVQNINTRIRDALRALSVSDQAALDRRLIELDGTADKSRLGANAIVAVSLACAHAAAAAAKMPLWRHLAGERRVALPVPQIQIFGGGAHARGRVDVQDYMVICIGAGSFAEALEWTAQVGILAPDDLVHAARLSPDSAAVVVERKEADARVFVYFGPRMDAPPADPYEATLLYDEPGVRSYVFAQRGHAMAHFLRATHGLGAALSLLSRRAPELRHIRRWTQALFAEPAVGRSTRLLAGWFATSGAGFLFVPSESDQPFAYCEVAIEG